MAQRSPPAKTPAAIYRFYLDEDIPKKAAAIGRSLGLDVVSADEVGPLPRPDAEHLAAAAALGRIMVTYNRNDFLEATRDAFAMGKPHAGLLILTHRLPRDAARIAHALCRWTASAANQYDEEPLQSYFVDFPSA